ncbi:hypothetical protein CIB48_g6987 [Xylaria polymorpha]|nr:hypothetical protein CIB48_g6987 [Xylaria polymorpha]
MPSHLHPFHCYACYALRKIAYDYLPDIPDITPTRREEYNHYISIICLWLAHFELDGPQYTSFDEPPDMEHHMKRMTDWVMAVDTESAPLTQEYVGSRWSSSSSSTAGSGESSTTENDESSMPGNSEEWEVI